MSTAISRKAKLTLVLLGSLLALTLGLVSGPAPANASTSGYCTGWLGASNQCTGAHRYLYQAYGWGDQASVCVGLAYWTGWSCSSGAGAGVYSAAVPVNVSTSPVISNNSGKNNFVHGIALTY